MRREELPFGRSFAHSVGRSFVCSSSWKKENDNVVAKSDDEGKKEQKERTGEKKKLL
jgi:hypothetical protein